MKTAAIGMVGPLMLAGGLSAFVDEPAKFNAAMAELVPPVHF